MQPLRFRDRRQTENPNLHSGSSQHVRSSFSRHRHKQLLISMIRTPNRVRYWDRPHPCNANLSPQYRSLVLPPSRPCRKVQNSYSQFCHFYISNCHKRFCVSPFYTAVYILVAQSTGGQAHLLYSTRSLHVNCRFLSLVTRTLPLNNTFEITTFPPTFSCHIRYIHSRRFFVFATCMLFLPCFYGALYLDVVLVLKNVVPSLLAHIAFSTSPSPPYSHSVIYYVTSFLCLCFTSHFPFIDTFGFGFRNVLDHTRSLLIHHYVTKYNASIIVVVAFSETKHSISLWAYQPTIYI
jgi:hypothetical protein